MASTALFVAAYTPLSGGVNRLATELILMMLPPLDAKCLNASLSAKSTPRTFVLEQ
jgi:hypothetical protein